LKTLLMLEGTFEERLVDSRLTWDCWDLLFQRHSHAPDSLWVFLSHMHTYLPTYSTSILVHVENGGLGKLQVIDNGCGISRDDLGLAAERHATSKLQSTEDFDTLSSFGFRGEALASMSIVARLQIVSRTAKVPTGFMQTYQNGAPIQPKPTPQARTPGTTVTVSDLFYNMLHRKKLKESDEYHKILAVVQHYAVQYPGVGFVCRKLQANKQIIDLNTNNLSPVQALLKAKKEGHETTELHDSATIDVMINIFGSAVKSNLVKFVSEANDKFTYHCRGFISNPSYASSHPTKLIMFINNRWVEFIPLKKALEGLYTEFAKTKPMIYLSLQLPGNEVDVNVHPTKKQVALLHQDDIITHICGAMKDLLLSTSHGFKQASVVPNPYKRKLVEVNEADYSTPPSTLLTSKSISFSQVVKKSSPSIKIRTSKAAPAGAMEPYLVLRSTEKTIVQHEPSCSMSKEMNLSQPGAFAQKCTCTSVIRKQRLPQVRPPKILPIECAYKSIHSLRSEMVKRCCQKLKDLFRKEAIFVGVLSDQRSLVQCGAELQCWHHGKIAELFFQQLALIRFGGTQMAMFGKPVDVKHTIGFALELEEQLANGVDKPKIEEITETNQDLARQAATCLLDRHELLEEHFSIGIESNGDRIMLVGLPILLEGYIPQLSGLALFLLRLATEINYNDERPCFLGVCRELGIYYGHTPEMDVQHKVFPAICQMMMPPKHMADDGTILTFTDLSSLYKVFERV